MQFYCIHVGLYRGVGVIVHVCYLHSGCRSSLDPQFPPPSSRQHSCTVDRRHHLLNIGHDLQQQPRTRSGNLKASHKNIYVNHRYCVPTAPSFPISLFPSFPSVRVSSLSMSAYLQGWIWSR